MHDLRIVGVEPEGENPHLLLSDEDGEEYALALDEALKSALNSVNEPAASEETAAPLSPRDIQSRIRGGATVEEVVESSGLSHEHVMRYAGPVADERAFFASRARGTTVARASTAEQHRLAFGDAPATLEAMVKVRLRGMGVRLDSAQWDAWRGEDGLWTVVCDFDANSSDMHAAGIGEQPPAEWSFDAAARSVRPINKWAESLTTLPDSPGPSRRTGNRRLAAVDEPFDVDDQNSSPARSAPGRHAPARGAIRRAPDAEPSGDETDGISGHQPGADQQDLLEILRARRGQRLGADVSDDDKLASLITRDESQETTSAASPLRPVEDLDEDTDHEGGHSPASGQDRARKPSPVDDDQPTMPIPPLDEEDEEGSDTDAWGFSYSDTGDEEAEAGQGSTSGEDESTQEGAQPGQPDEAEHDDQQKDSRKSRRSRRPAMPRWDDILFGTKDD